MELQVWEWRSVFSPGACSLCRPMCGDPWPLHGCVRPKWITSLYYHAVLQWRCDYGSGRRHVDTVRVSTSAVRAYVYERWKDLACGYCVQGAGKSDILSYIKFFSMWAQPFLGYTSKNNKKHIHDIRCDCVYHPINSHNRHGDTVTLTWHTLFYYTICIHTYIIIFLINKCKWNGSPRLHVSTWFSYGPKGNSTQRLRRANQIEMIFPNWQNRLIVWLRDGRRRRDRVQGVSLGLHSLWQPN